ncbi:hypothetical protein HaLaN_24787, partial [Haematococcus lacustris]
MDALDGIFANCAVYHPPFA